MIEEMTEAITGKTNNPRGKDKQIEGKGNSEET